MIRKHAAAWLTVGAGLCVAALIWMTVVRSFPSPRVERQAREDERGRVRAAQSSYSGVAGFQPLADITDFEPLLSAHLDKAAMEALGVNRSRTLLSEVASFLRLRLRGDSPSDYVAWRRARGYDWRPYQELVDLAIVDAFRVRTSRKWSASDPIEERFAQMWRSAREWKGHVNVPVGIGTSKESMGVVWGSINWRQSSTYRPIGTVIPAAGRDQTGSLTSVQWLTPARNRATLLKENEAVEFAAIGVLIEYADGSRRPLTLTFLWDPQTRRWVHDLLTVFAGAKDEILGIDY